MMNIGKLLLAVTLLAAPVAHSANACVNGEAGGYACSHIDLLGRLTVTELGGASSERVNDIWGWTDPVGGEEYAIVGMYDGTAFVRLGADGTPEFLGRLAGSDGKSPVTKSAPAVLRSACHDECDTGEEASAWRDVKVYENYAFIVSEATGFGMQVFDLTRLRSAAGETDWGVEDAHYAGVGHAHNIFINEDSARAYIVGSGANHDSGGLHVVDISDPLNPQFLANINQDGYTHDVQCVMYRGPDPEFSASDEICFASNEDTVTIWRVNDPINPERLARFGYAGASYVHQGWLSEDQAYFYFNDELDEQRTGSRTKLRVLNVSDLRAPTLAAEYLSPSLAIDHNNYVHGRWLLQSNYTSGLRILDILEPEQPVQAAYFDTVPNSDSADFNGNWSNFWFPGSGRVVLSDMGGGLFVVAPMIEEGGTAPDLSVSLALDQTVLPADDSTGSGEFVIRNGTATEADSVLVTVHLPTGATFEEVAAPAGSNCAILSFKRVVECQVQLLAADATEAFGFEIGVYPGATFELVAMVYSNHADAAPADNIVSATLSREEVDDTPQPRSSGYGGGAIFWLQALLLIGVGFRWHNRQRKD